MTTGQLLFTFSVVGVLAIGTADHLIRVLAYRRRTARLGDNRVVDLTLVRAIKQHPAGKRLQERAK